METTYTALLRGNQLEWQDTAPPTSDDVPILVQVTLVNHPISQRTTQRGYHMHQILERLAQHHAFGTIPHPGQWEQDIRVDRPLPDRE